MLPYRTSHCSSVRLVPTHETKQTRKGSWLKTVGSGEAKTAAEQIGREIQSEEGKQEAGFSSQKTTQ